MTITALLPQETPQGLLSPPLRLRLEGLPERLNRFLDELQASPLIDREALQEWRDDFDREFSHLVDGENEEVALALCVLLCQVIDPAMDATDKGSQEEQQIQNFEETLHALLKTTVPRRESVDQFITTYEAFFEQRELLNEQLEVIETIFQEKMEQLCASANDINGELQAKYQQLKGRLREINQHQMKEMTKTLANVEAQAIAVNNLIEEFYRLSSHLQSMDARLEGIKATLIQAAEECKQTLTRLRRL